MSRANVDSQRAESPDRNAEPPPKPDDVDEASAESFPASDPPTFTGSTASPSQQHEDCDSSADDRHAG